MRTFFLSVMITFIAVIFGDLLYCFWLWPELLRVPLVLVVFTDPFLSLKLSALAFLALGGIAATEI